MKIEVIEHRNQNLRKFEPSLEELKKLVSGNYDYYRNELYGETKVIQKKGEVINHQSDIPKIGKTRIMFLDTLQVKPGVFWAPWDIGKYCEEHYGGNGADKKLQEMINSLYIKSNIISSAHLVRTQVFGDTTDYFIKTRRNNYGVSWNRDRSFLIIRPKRSES